MGDDETTGLFENLPLPFPFRFASGSSQSDLENYQEYTERDLLKRSVICPISLLKSSSKGYGSEIVEEANLSDNVSL